VKKYFVLVLSLLFFASCNTPRSLTDEMVGHKPKERTWNRRKQRKEMRNKTAYNPYLEMKAKDKPNAKLSKENKRIERIAKRTIRREKRKLRRTKGAYK
jgi:hypothetical protein